MAPVQGEGANALQNDNQPQFTADKLLLQQFTEAHLQLREQEKATSQALFEKHDLDDQLGSLKLELVHKDRNLVATERSRDMEVKELSDARDEARMGLEEAKLAIDKLLSASVAPSPLCSRRPYMCLIIDGDANHFLPMLLKAGAAGGNEAAQRLKREISNFIAARRHIPQSCVVKVQIFMNRTGFVDTVHRIDHTAKHLINSCLDHFFQTQPTWDLVDTGALRESADTKIKANFKFFVDDSDCFALIMGTCSDNGYVQLLQEFQGDPEKMYKIVLLTSCNTTADIQKLTYAIVQWTAVFRSKPISTRNSLGLAGPQIKDVTPLADLNSVTTNSGKAIKSSSASKLPTCQVARLPSIPISVPSMSGSHSVGSLPPSKPAQSQARHQRRQKNRISNTSGMRDQEFACTAATNMAINPRGVAKRERSKQNLSEDPDGELTHVFHTSIKPVMKDLRPRPLMENLTSQLNVILPHTGSVMATIASSIAGKPLLCSLISNDRNLAQDAAENTHRSLVASSHARDKTITTSASTDLSGQTAGETHVAGTVALPVSQQAPPTFPNSLPKPFIHIPIPVRAEGPSYDPDRYLYQQSPHYLACNQQNLGAIVSYAKRHQHKLAKAVRSQLNRRIDVAELSITRLCLAQEIQRLEDCAVRKQVCCSQPSTSRSGDAWANDRSLYYTMSRALGFGIKPVMVKLPNRIARSGLADVDWVVLIDGRTWKS